MASTYFKDTIGQVLADVLIDCVRERPDDPVEFVANALEKYESGKMSMLTYISYPRKGKLLEVNNKETKSQIRKQIEEIEQLKDAYETMKLANTIER